MVIDEDQVSVTFGNEDESLLLRSSGSAISFPGYLAVFKVKLVFSVPKHAPQFDLNSRSVLLSSKAMLIKVIILRGIGHIYVVGCRYLDTKLY